MSKPLIFDTVTTDKGRMLHHIIHLCEKVITLSATEACVVHLSKNNEIFPLVFHIGLQIFDPSSFMSINWKMFEGFPACNKCYLHRNDIPPFPASEVFLCGFVGVLRIIIMGGDLGFNMLPKNTTACRMDMPRI